MRAYEYSATGYDQKGNPMDANGRPSDDRYDDDETIFSPDVRADPDRVKGARYGLATVLASAAVTILFFAYTVWALVAVFAGGK